MRKFLATHRRIKESRMRSELPYAYNVRTEERNTIATLPRSNGRGREGVGNLQFESVMSSKPRGTQDELPEPERDAASAAVHACLQCVIDIY